MIDLRSREASLPGISYLASVSARLDVQTPAIAPSPARLNCHCS